jgi:hydrogenase maturation factor|nr:MAG TPA: zinc-ribbon family protein [Bacteriophage sp.]
MSDKNDDFYDNYDDKSGKGILMVGGCILGLLFLIISFIGLIEDGTPFPLIITICYISIIVGYIYYQKKNSKLSDDFVPSGKTKEEILDNYVTIHKVKEKREKEFEQQLEQARRYQANAQAQELLNKVHCPYCNSTNCKKISGVSKATSVAMFGIFSQKVKKQWHCNNCRSDF